MIAELRHYDMINRAMKERTHILQQGLGYSVCLNSSVPLFHRIYFILRYTIWRLIQFAITICYQRSRDLSSLRPRRDGSHVI